MDLNRQAAEKVMGWIAYQDAYIDGILPDRKISDWKPDTDNNDLEMVIQKCIEDGRRIETDRSKGETYCCVYGDNLTYDYHAEDPNFNKAVLQAVISAYGGEE